jgi:energy-coupling factor transport system ATP-binding protein
VRIVLRNVRVDYDTGLPSATAALDGVSLELEQGRCVGVVGPTGSGKTTLLEVMAGLARPSSGSAALEPTDASVGLRDAVGLAYQFPESQFFEETVFLDVAFGPTKQGLGESDVRTRVRNALTRAGLSADEFGPRSPLSLSAGEKRRAAIAGILALGRPFLLLDEPTAGLDPHSAETIAALVSSELSEGHGVVVVTHDLEFVDAHASRTIVMDAGAVLADGSTRDVLSDGRLLSGVGLEPPARYAVVSRLLRLGHPEAERIGRILGSLASGSGSGPLAEP